MRWRKEAAPPEAIDGPDDEAADVDPDDEGALAADVPARTERPDVPVDLGRVPGDELARAMRRLVARALTEDLAGEVDVTSTSTVPVGTRGRALLVAREAGVVAGLDAVAEVCQQVDQRLAVRLHNFDGDAVQRGDVVADVEGPLRTLLTAERTLLNIVCHLSGVATRTRAFADLLQGTDCVVRDTRKTTPGMRLLEKHAVAAAGGANHRIGLYDAVLVKDNHVAAAGGVGPAARAALDWAAAHRRPDGTAVHVQVEVTSVAEAEEAIAAGVTDLLLDNFTPDELRAAVRRIAGRAAVEASGGITLETARDYAEAGADRLAVGALTHSAPALDLALDVSEVTSAAQASAASAAAAETAAETAADMEDADDSGAVLDGTDAPLFGGPDDRDG